MTKKRKSNIISADLHQPESEHTLLQNGQENNKTIGAAPVRCGVTHTLKLKGLTRPYKLMHVTDVHIAAAYPDEPELMQAEAELLGPAECPLVKIASNWRYQLLLRGKKIGPLQQAAADFMERYRAFRFSSGLPKTQAATECCSREILTTSLPARIWTF